MEARRKRGRARGNACEQHIPGKISYGDKNPNKRVPHAWFSCVKEGRKKTFSKRKLFQRGVLEAESRFHVTRSGRPFFHSRCYSSIGFCMAPEWKIFSMSLVIFKSPPLITMQFPQICLLKCTTASFFLVYLVYRRSQLKNFISFKPPKQSNVSLLGLSLLSFMQVQAQVHRAHSHPG